MCARHEAGMLVLFLLFVGVLFWWIIYKFTIYALPCLLGVAAGQFAYQTEAGWVGAFIVGGVTALLVFGAMRWLYRLATAPALRMLVSFVFVAPSALMAYFVFEDITLILVPSDLWRQAICSFGAGIAGLTAFVRLSEAPLE
jgi:hypothetical protein